MKRLHLLTLAMASGLLLAGCASNDIDKPMTNQGEEKHFNLMDRSKDGYITKDELDAGDELLLSFEAHDLNGDGRISEHEFGEYIANIPD
ncbi:MAG TPA: hypothetical protein VFL14_05365 [Xanthomonadales bacterium]|nr:hypothetical protein [Xanthomonadales bacterium]